MRAIEITTNGFNYIEKSYKGFKLTAEEVIIWNNNLRDIDEEAFLPLIIAYCQTEPAPECASDIINFARKMMVDTALSPERFVRAFINAIEQMRKDNFIYTDPSIEEQTQYITCKIFLKYPEARIDYVQRVITDMVHEYFQSLEDAIDSGNSTTLAICSSEIKAKYTERLYLSASHTTFTLDTIKLLENKVSKNSELPQSNKFMEIEGGSEWN